MANWSAHPGQQESGLEQQSRPARPRQVAESRPDLGQETDQASGNRYPRRQPGPPGRPRRPGGLGRAAARQAGTAPVTLVAQRGGAQDTTGKARRPAQERDWSAPSFPDGDPIGSSLERMGRSSSAR
jgi:hypothetical protein